MKDITYILFYTYENQEGMYDSDAEITYSIKKLKKMIADRKDCLEGFRIDRILKVNDYEELNEEDL